MTPEEVREVATHAVAKMSVEDLERFERELIPSAELAVHPRVTQANSNTTHFCVLDQHGDAVSNTYSLNTMFGSKLAVGGAGFLLNNCMDDFGIAGDVPNWYDLVHGDLNRIQPGRRPVSSMSPSLVTHNDQVEIIIGGSGGPRIPTLVAQIITSIVMDDIPLDEAVRRPRIHHQFLPKELAVERRMPENTTAQLMEHGQQISRMPMLGIGAAIHRKPETNELAAVLDSRFSFE